MGRLAVVLDTGFTDFLPGGAGLLAYRSPEEARETVARVRADYEGQSRAARAVAEEFFAGRRVLGDLLGESR
jgi:hypothetical protein